MMAGQSILNDNNQNNATNETADQDETMMEVDGQVDNTNMELNKTIGHSAAEEHNVNVTTEKIPEYYFRATNTADDGHAGDTVDTVIIFDTLETADTAYTDEMPETAEQSDFMSRVIDDYLESEDYKPILRIIQEQLLILDYTPVNMAMVHNINEELPNDNTDATGPPEQSAMITDHNDQPESARTEHNGPIHDRCVHGEINTIIVPLNKSEIYFKMAHPYELLPLSKYYLQEWSELEDLFLLVMDFEEEIDGDRSPCPSPPPTSIGL